MVAVTRKYRNLRRVGQTVWKLLSTNPMTTMATMMATAIVRTRSRDERGPFTP
jgi:hypothetical protein